MQLNVLCHAELRSADDGGHMRAVTVAVAGLTIAHQVREHIGPSTEVLVGCADAVNNTLVKP